MCIHLGIHKKRNTPQHPQSDGLVEHFNLTLNPNLSTLIPTVDGLGQTFTPGSMVLPYGCTGEHAWHISATDIYDLHTPVDITFCAPPPGPDYICFLQSSLMMAHVLARESQRDATSSQKQACIVHRQG